MYYCTDCGEGTEEVYHVGSHKICEGCLVELLLSEGNAVDDEAELPVTGVSFCTQPYTRMVAVLYFDAYEQIQTRTMTRGAVARWLVREGYVDVIDARADAEDRMLAERAEARNIRY